MSDKVRAAEQTAADGRSPGRLRWLRGLTLGGVLALLLGPLLVGLAAALALRTEVGTATLLKQLPGLHVVAPQGSLWGAGFAAQRIEWQGPRGSRLVLDGVQWQGLRLAWAAHAQWRVAVHADQLAVRRATLHWVGAGKADTPGAPVSLQMPVALDVAQLSIGQWQSNLTGAAPLGIERVSLALQQPSPTGGAAAHRLRGLQLRWQGWQITADAQVLLAGANPLSANVRAESELDQADVRISGTVSAMQLEGQVGLKRRGAGHQQAVQPSAQQLAVSARLAPFDAWPLPQASIRARLFDAQRLVASWPRTALTGGVDITSRDQLVGAPGTRMQSPGPGKGGGEAAASDLLVHVDVRNEASGLWDASRVPILAVLADVTLPGQANTHQWAGTGRSGRVAGRLSLPAAGGRKEAQVQVQGRWDLDRWQNTALVMNLKGLETQVFHSSAPALRLDGAVRVQGQPDRNWLVSGRLQGVDGGRKALGAPVLADVSARWQPQRLELISLALQSGQAQATASGLWAQQADGGVKAKADLNLQGFDPAVWLPWPVSAADARQSTRLQGHIKAQVSLPAQGSWVQRLQAAQGDGSGQLRDSLLLGVPTTGQWQWQKGQALQGRLQLLAAGNEVQIQANLPSSEAAWQQWVGAELRAMVQAPALAGLQPWAKVLGVASLSGQMALEGRWAMPQAGHWSSQGQWRADNLQALLQGGETVRLQGSRAQWSLADAARQGSAADQAAATDAPWLILAEVGRLQWGPWVLQQGDVNLRGDASQHQLDVQARLDLPERKLPSGKVFKESVRVLAGARGRLQHKAGQPPHWQGQVQSLKVAPLSVAQADPWLDVQPFDASWQAGGGSLGSTWLMGPARATVLGAVLSVQQFRSQGLAGGRSSFEAHAQLEPLRVADMLARWQPRAGWGGDLLLTGQLHAALKPDQGWVVDAQISRKDGDLSLTETSIEGGGPQRLGLRNLLIELKARDGAWSARQQIEGRLLGTLEAQQQALASSTHALPTANSPLQGQFSFKMSNLRPLGAWAPAGWRLGGQMSVQARLSGTVGLPQYSGQVTGEKLLASHALLGLAFSEGELLMTLQGTQARLERLVARGGAEPSGRLQISGDAALGTQPSATLLMQLDRFALLNRVDRRAVVSGQAQVQLGADSIKADGQLKIDEGLIDLSREDAPTVGDDVNVLNRPGEQPDEDLADAQAPRRKWQVNLGLDLGSRLRLKGRGLDARLSGALRLSTPNGRPMVQGNISASDGTYMAYGQKLVIERGALTFTGPVDNPRLDILAMRAQSPTASTSDVKVGVLISGTAQDPRVRLYSEPSMSETEKLSWLVLGRSPTGLGGADIGLLQTAASALLAGEGASPKDNLIGAIGLDELSVRQSDGAVRDTIVSVGKQVSRHWYLGYERSLNATTGTWQAIYRLAQRFTLRAQTGEDDAIDLIWSLRWGEP